MLGVFANDLSAGKIFGQGPSVEHKNNPAPFGYCTKVPMNHHILLMALQEFLKNLVDISYACMLLSIIFL